LFKEPYNGIQQEVVTSCRFIIVTHYPSRLPDLESICLFDYVQLYDIVKTKPVGKNIKHYVYPNYGYIKERTQPYLIKHTIYNIQSEPEKYFHSLLMLFQPWRQEVKIIENHKTYLDAFISCRDKIESTLHYHERLEYLRKSKYYLDTIIEDLLQKNKKHKLMMIGFKF